MSSESQSLTPGLYQCTRCSRTYTRVDHLARHVRTHLQERPFKCQSCPKAYGRLDLLKRHAQCHDPAQILAKRQRLEASASNFRRVSQACNGCASAKVKCEEEKPCKRCRHLRLTCHVSNTSSARTGNPSDTSEPDVTSSVDDINQGNERTIPASQTMLTPSTIETETSAGNPSPNAQDLLSQTEMLPSLSPSLWENSLADFLRDVTAPVHMNNIGDYHQESWPLSETEYRNVLDYSLDNDISLDSPDVEFLSRLFELPPDSLLQRRTHDNSGMRHEYDHLGPECANPIGTQTQLPTVDTSSLPRSPDSVASEQIGEIPASQWLPGHQEDAERAANQLPPSVDGTDSLDMQPSPKHKYLTENLEASARDKLLAMILSTCSEDEGARVAAVFLCKRVLNEILENFFWHNHRMPQSFIHAPTFNPNKEPTELLGAIIAIGAVLSEIRAVQRVGFALQEAVRLIIPKRIEKSASGTKELWLMQALMWEVMIGLYSGNRRRREVAESHTQTLNTMIRRNNLFQKNKTLSVAPLPDDTGAVLHEKWHQWVQQESYRRLVWHAFRSDAFASMALLVNPLISYAEIGLSLPHSQDLWVAENAERWKYIYLNQAPGPVEHLSLVGFLKHPLKLCSLPRLYDKVSSTLSVLHGLWGMIWEYTQFASIMGGQHDHDDATIALRHQGLCQKVDDLRTVISGFKADNFPMHEVSLTVELLSMYLHVSLERIQHFAGKEGLEDARRVFPLLQHWANTSHARQAIWNAGQVLRIGRAYPIGNLKGFTAIAVYHAGLTCWAYGLISQMNGSREETCQGAREPTGAIFLDGHCSATAQAFIKLGHGNPSIHRTGSVKAPSTDSVALSDPGAVIGVVLKILKDNVTPSGNGDALPPVLDNLIQMILDLQEAGKSVIRHVV